MPHLFKRSALALAASILAFSALAETQKLTILHTNDHHGRFWENKYGEYGMAARKTLIDQIRAEVAAEGGSVLLLSGGDINTGVPESDLQDAEPDFKGMTLLGYDAMALGNHEFDNPLEVLAKQQRWADFPMLSANIYDKKTGKRAFQPYAIFDRQGLKIAVIGLTTEDTARVGNPDHVSGLEFRDEKAEALKVIAELKANHQPDLIIAATHMGHYADGNHGINAPGDVSLARTMNEGDLDMIIGGHSQVPVCMEDSSFIHKYNPDDECMPDRQNGTWIMQAYEWGKYVGRADFEMVDGELNLVSYDLIPVNLKKKIKLEDGSSQRVLVGDEIAHDPTMRAFLKPYQEKGQELLNVKIGEANADLIGDRVIVRSRQTNLGRLIGLAHMEQVGADFAIMNAGGVRDSIGAGDITYKDVLKVQPFANVITLNTMTGAEIIDYLNQVATKPANSGAFAQLVGISLVVQDGQVSDVKIGGKPLDPNQTYSFTIPSFNAAGGDGYPKLTSHPGHVNTGFVDADALKGYIEKNSPLNVADFQPKGEVVYR